MFTLIVDDFGEKYTNKDGVIHLHFLLEREYTVTSGWVGIKNVGISINCDYDKVHIYLAMPGYIWSTLQMFWHPP